MEETSAFDNLLQHNRGNFSFLESEKPITASDFKQIDLNDEKNLLELEDPILIKHMHNSRKMLDETIKKNNESVFTQTREDLEKELINQAKEKKMKNKIREKPNKSRT
jgi:hypothetical protein